MASSAMVNLVMSEFGLPGRPKKLTVHGSIDFTTQNLLGTFDSQICHIFAQCFTCFGELLTRFLLCSRDDFGSFVCGFALASSHGLADALHRPDG